MYSYPYIVMLWLQGSSGPLNPAFARELSTLPAFGVAIFFGILFFYGLFSERIVWGAQHRAIVERDERERVELKALNEKLNAENEDLTRAYQESLVQNQRLVAQLSEFIAAAAGKVRPDVK